MPAELVRYVVCEGPDDLGALRALARELVPGCRVSGSKLARRLTVTTPRVSLDLVAAPGAKSGLAARVLDLAEGTAAHRPDAIGVVFDPDRDALDKEFAFFKKDYDRLSQTQQRGSRLQRTKTGYAVTIRKREVRVLPGAWRSDPPVSFDDLPDEHDLERVLIGGILAAGVDAELAAWALESTHALRTLVRDHGWKRAFRIWNAALEPKSESFVDRLLEAPETKTACLAALRATPAAELLAELLP